MQSLRGGAVLMCDDAVRRKDLEERRVLIEVKAAGVRGQQLLTAYPAEDDTYAGFSTLRPYWLGSLRTATATRSSGGADPYVDRKAADDELNRALRYAVG